MYVVEKGFLTTDQLNVVGLQKPGLLRPVCRGESPSLLKVEFGRQYTEQSFTIVEKLGRHRLLNVVRNERRHQIRGLGAILAVRDAEYTTATDAIPQAMTAKECFDVDAPGLEVVAVGAERRDVPVNFDNVAVHDGRRIGLMLGG